MRRGQLTFLLISLFSLVHAGTVGKDGPCSTGNNRLQPGTFQFWSECDSQTFCSDQGLCVKKRCRRDDFPFGYPQGDDLPPKCREGEFCPDEGTDCQPLLPVGSPCQLNRDDQCEPPPNFKELADTTGFGLNVNGSVCLNNVCMWANQTLGNPCTVENVAYTAYRVNDDEFVNVVSRGDCAPGLYCETVSKTCLKNKELGETCDADKECASFNCLSNGVCGVAAATPREFGAWVYVLVALGIIGGMGGTLTALYYSHRKQRDIERAKRAQYWREQNAFHQNLMQMRETARASILSMPNNNGSRDLSDDQAPLTSSGHKSSGLRNYMDNDGSSEFEDGGLMMNGRGHEGRF